MKLPFEVTNRDDLQMPRRVPLARLGAAQAALKESGAAAYTAAGG